MPQQMRIAVLVNNYAEIQGTVGWAQRVFGMENSAYNRAERTLRDGNRIIYFLYPGQEFNVLSMEFDVYIKSPNYIDFETHIKIRTRLR